MAKGLSEILGEAEGAEGSKLTVYRALRQLFAPRARVAVDAPAGEAKPEAGRHARREDLVEAVMKRLSLPSAARKEKGFELEYGTCEA